MPHRPRRHLFGPTLIAVLLAIGLGPAANGAETAVSVAPGVPGRLVVPDAGSPKAAVLLLHGFNGRMDEVGRLYVDLADALAERGIASLRFDFSGEGPTVDFVVTSTRESRVAETEAAYAALRAAVPDVPVGINGFSLGGLTAMLVAGAHPQWFDVMVLWSAASRLDFGSDPAMAAVARRALRDGQATYEDWTRITLTREFLISWYGVDGSGSLADFPGSLLAIRGTEDFLPMDDPAWLAATPSEDDAFVLIGGADHIFDVLEEPPPDHGARVIEHTVDWFAARL